MTTTAACQDPYETIRHAFKHIARAAPAPAWANGVLVFSSAMLIAAFLLSGLVFTTLAPPGNEQFEAARASWALGIAYLSAVCLVGFVVSYTAIRVGNVFAVVPAEVISQTLTHVDLACDSEASAIVREELERCFDPAMAPMRFMEFYRGGRRALARLHPRTQEGCAIRHRFDAARRIALAATQTIAIDGLLTTPAPAPARRWTPLGQAGAPVVVSELLKKIGGANERYD